LTGRSEGTWYYRVAVTSAGGDSQWSNVVSTVVGDAYEVDDACNQATITPPNGSAQLHTFHTPGDEDWVRLDVISGTTYIAEIYNVGPSADSVAAVYRTCGLLPASGVTRVFGNGYTFSFTAKQTTPYYIKVYHHDSPTVYGPGTDYLLSVRPVAANSVAIIVAGHDDAYNYQDNIDYAADLAYRTFRNAGLTKTNIYYLGPNLSHDADDNGLGDDIDATSAVANVRDAIQTWAKERGVGPGAPLYIYMVDHGVIDRFKADGDALANHVTAADLNLWLSNLEAATGADTINIIIDACYSGSFIDVTATGLATISGPGRVVIASTTSSSLAWGPKDGAGLYFSDAFLTALGNEQSLWASYLAGQSETAVYGQTPWLDDNGDRKADSLDGAVASNRALRRVAMGGMSPRIGSVSVVVAGSTATLQAPITDDSGWLEVKVEVLAPSYVLPAPDGSGTMAIVDVPVVMLTDPDGDRVFTGTYTLAERGFYRLVVRSVDAEDNLALSRAVQLCHSCMRVYLPIVIRR
jgi:hypothetical protein